MKTYYVCLNFLKVPGLNRIAKKLGIDCSPAVVGFDGHKGSVHPV